MKRLQLNHRHECQTRTCQGAVVDIGAGRRLLEKVGEFRAPEQRQVDRNGVIGVRCSHAGDRAGVIRRCSSESTRVWLSAPGRR